ncbi:dihydrofolate reductase family protein [uncultured Sphaerochaeta sp.]|uniref:dihydrofolate reductase family protein n=1 Tax=uncultured Sphaerochaeta sp. TaxID=886478 RepID=UPI002A0A8E92|nr:dihydrofolate reductase family protein [uncultured Sphaerochaeta sp.]
MNYVYIATSLDGYIATNEGSLDWLTSLPTPTDSDYGYSVFLQNIDAIVMGKNTFETVSKFTPWPYEKPVFVLSSGLRSIPEALKKHVSLVSGNIPNLLSQLHEKGFKTLYIDGGKTIQSFLELDLIDEMTITRVPILLGKGIPLFKESTRIKQFTHIKTEVFDNGLVMSTYRKRKSDTL